MSNRNPIPVVIFSPIACGFYYVYWLVRTKGEMNNLGAKIPTAWLIIIPFVNIYWLWRWSQGVEKSHQGSVDRGVGALALLVSVVDREHNHSNLLQQSFSSLNGAEILI